MATIFQIRNVPDDLHRRLKARAALEGVSMSVFILQAIERALTRSIRRELIEAIHGQPEVELDPSPAGTLREEHEARDP